MALSPYRGWFTPPPVGADLGGVEGLRQSFHLFEPKHYVLLFLGHCAGTFIGALVATILALGRTSGPAYVVASVSLLLGGFAYVAFQLTPMWFGMLDLAFAYLPMAWLAHRVAAQRLAEASK
jgi:hypothetical protein